jgi:hypothetical protein
MALSSEFINRLSLEYKGYSLEGEEQIIRFAKQLINLEPLPYQLEAKPYEESLLIIEDILNKINPEYLKLFKQMLVEQNQAKPVIYAYNSSNSNTKRNESFTYKNEVHFYKTNTISDVYLLLHEFTHFLMNRQQAFSQNKMNNEIPPILIEFIISEQLNDYNYLKERLSFISFDAKSLLLKKEIINGNTNLSELYIKYNLTLEEIEQFEEELLYSKSLKYEEERNYIYGLLQAFQLSLANNIENYNTLVEELTVNRNITLAPLSPTVLESLVSKLAITNNKNL